MQQRVDSTSDAIECLKLYIDTLSDVTVVSKLKKVLANYVELAWRMRGLED
jgi:hypothetical protein